MLRLRRRAEGVDFGEFCQGSVIRSSVGKMSNFEDGGEEEEEEEGGRGGTRGRGGGGKEEELLKEEEGR